MYRRAERLPRDAATSPDETRLTLDPYSGSVRWDGQIPKPQVVDIVLPPDLVSEELAGRLRPYTGDELPELGIRVVPAATPDEKPSVELYVEGDDGRFAHLVGGTKPILQFRPTDNGAKIMYTKSDGSEQEAYTISVSNTEVSVRSPMFHTSMSGPRTMPEANNMLDAEINEVSGLRGEDMAGFAAPCSAWGAEESAEDAVEHVEEDDLLSASFL
eukprot:tig00000093_g3477.t1